MHNELAAKIWLADICTRNNYSHPKLLPDGRYAVVAPFLFTHAIITGRVGDADTYADRWCYNNEEEARVALDRWSGEGEPQGWKRHPTTGRRRTPEGDETIAH